MANPEIKKLKQRIQSYRETHPDFAGPAPPVIKRKPMRTSHKLTGKEVCAYCGKKLTKHTATIDHIIPLSRGGTDFKWNLAWCCYKCNKSKGSKLLSEWLEEI